MAMNSILTLYVAPLAMIWAAYALRRSRLQSRAVMQRGEAQEAGLTEPMSLHPVIDPGRCFGCKACIYACPESSVLGLIANKAQLVEPSNCIGHGACKTACPQGAISLVFGSETRGVELPVVRPNFETDVPGIYIAGELGGMGLIRNAVEQGRQAIHAIADSARRKARRQDFLDVVIIGAGPSGISASLGAMEKSLAFVTLEQDTLGGTVAHFPRGKVVMTSPAMLPLVGKMHFKEVGKEKLLAYWHSVIETTNLKIRTRERVEGVTAIPGGFLVQTARAAYATHHVLLTIGRRGTPRRLDVPGEDLPKVAYRMIDPVQYRGQHVLVVGGGDSALEAACALAEQPRTRVTLSYRNATFQRAKAKNRAAIERLQKDGKVELLLASQVAAIATDHVVLVRDGQPFKRRNDKVIVCAGGLLPTDFLKSMGIGIETKYGTR